MLKVYAWLYSLTALLVTPLHSLDCSNGAGFFTDTDYTYKNEIDRCRLSYPTVYEGVEISQDPPPPATILGDLH